MAGDDEREELDREVSAYELEGEEDDQPDEMTVDSGEGGPANAADGEPPDGEDGSGDESEGQDGAGGGGGRGPARRPGGQDAADSGGQSATDSEDLAGGGDRPPAGAGEDDDHPASRARHAADRGGKRHNERWACPSRSGSIPHKPETVTGSVVRSQAQ